MILTSPERKKNTKKKDFFLTLFYCQIVKNVQDWAITCQFWGNVLTSICSPSTLPYYPHCPKFQSLVSWIGFFPPTPHQLSPTSPNIPQHPHHKGLPRIFPLQGIRISNLCDLDFTSSSNTILK
jgi:hypothetical protein